MFDRLLLETREPPDDGFIIETRKGKYSHYHPHNKNAQEVEQKHPQKSLLRGGGNDFARVHRLRTRNCYDLDVAEAEGSRQQDLPERKESASRSSHDVFVEGAWVSPVGKAESFVVRSASQIDDESTDDETDDEHNLERGEDDLGL